MTAGRKRTPAGSAVTELQGRIGLTGAVVALVGYIIGGSIFILPVSLLREVGPGVFLAYIVAACLALFVCMVSAQIGSAFPMSGGTYVAVSCVLSPFWGFLVVWMGTVIVFTSTAALAYGFVDYLAASIPGVGEYRFLGAVSTIVLFTLVNLLGIRTTVSVQAVLVAIFVAVLLAVGVGGVAQGDFARFSPLFPAGPAAVLMAAVPAFYSFSGFSAVVTFGGEIVNPRRNIPLVLLISFPLILALYLLVTIAVAAVLPWGAAGDPTLTRVAEAILPGRAAVFIAAAALCAIATSINGLLLSKSRDLFSLALDRVLPAPLARIGPYGEPRAALLVMCLVAILGVSLRRSFAEYAGMAVLCVMVVHALQGAVLLLLPRRLPEHFEAASLQLNPGARRFWGAGMVLAAIGFILVGLVNDPVGGLIYLLACALGALYYLDRRRALRRQGLDIDDLLLEHAAHVLPARLRPHARRRVSLAAEGTSA